MNTDTEPSESELSGDEERNKKKFYKSNGNLISDCDLKEAERLENARPEGSISDE